MIFTVLFNGLNSHKPFWPATAMDLPFRNIVKTNINLLSETACTAEAIKMNLGSATGGKQVGLLSSADDWLRRR